MHIFFWFVQILFGVYHLADGKGSAGADCGGNSSETKMSNQTGAVMLQLLAVHSALQASVGSGALQCFRPFSSEA